MEQLPMEYPVGLTREEYVRSQELQTRGNRALRLIPLITAVVFLLILAVDMLVTRQVDVPLTAMVVIVALAEIVTSITGPKVIRRRYEETYDQTRYGGYCFDGVVKITETQISKITPSGEAVIPFNGCYYTEAADMMIFRNQHGKCIVIPARCLTEADAAVTRDVAFQNVPVHARRLLGRLVPALEERLPSPSLEKPLPEDPLLTVAVEYTLKEFKDLTIDAALDGAVQTLSSKVLMAAVLAMLVYDVSSFGMVAAFLLITVILLLFPLLPASAKARRAVAVTDSDVLKLTVEMTPSFLRMRGVGEHARQLEIPWKDISRGVELPKRVELYTHKKILTIPKRCIPDMDELRRVVDTQMEAAKEA